MTQPAKKVSHQLPSQPRKWVISYPASQESESSVTSSQESESSVTQPAKKVSHQLRSQSRKWVISYPTHIHVTSIVSQHWIFHSTQVLACYEVAWRSNAVVDEWIPWHKFLGSQTFKKYSLTTMISVAANYVYNSCCFCCWYYTAEKLLVNTNAA